MKLFKTLLEHEGPVSDFAIGYAESSRFANSSIGYPDLDKLQKNDGVKPEWFYDVRDRGDASEMVAIHQYVDNSSEFEEYADLALGVGIVEMIHLDRLTDVIMALGGSVKRHWSNKAQVFGKDVKDAVGNDIKAEKQAIKDYTQLLKKLEPIKTNTGIACHALVKKLLADEEHHLKLLEQFQKTLS